MGSNAARLSGDFFTALGFTQVRTDIAKRDQLVDLLVTGLNQVRPTTQEEREAICKLTRGLAKLKSAPAESRAELKRFAPARPDPEDDAQLMWQIRASRERVMRELETEKQLLASRAA